MLWPCFPPSIFCQTSWKNSTVCISSTYYSLAYVPLILLPRSSVTSYCLIRSSFSIFLLLDLLTAFEPWTLLVVNLFHLLTSKIPFSPGPTFISLSFLILWLFLYLHTPEFHFHFYSLSYMLFLCGFIYLCGFNFYLTVDVPNCLKSLPTDQCVFSAIS